MAQSRNSEIFIDYLHVEYVHTNIGRNGQKMIDWESEVLAQPHRIWMTLRENYLLPLVLISPTEKRRPWTQGSLRMLSVVVYQSMVCKNQNPNLLLNRSQKQETLTRNEKHFRRIEGKKNSIRDLRIPHVQRCKEGRRLSQNDIDNSLLDQDWNSAQR